MRREHLADYEGVDRMEFLEPRGLRFERALWDFMSGKCMAYRGVNFWLAPDGYLEVRVHPDFRVDHDEGQRSLDDLCFARSVAEEISARSQCFASAIEGTPWRLVKLDESGTKVLFLYCPEEDKIIWSLGVA
jgi:hypothetical protein